MKRHLTEEEEKRIDRRISEAEKRTGAQIVLAVAGRSDAYPELPWKAFALAASFAAFFAVVLDFLRQAWHSPATTLFIVAITLLCGAAAALAVVIFPFFARLFLDRQRAEAETRQYAESMFLSREIFATKKRTGVLIFVSLFERQVIVLPDSGLAAQINKDALSKIIAQMAPLLAQGRLADALEQGISGLEYVFEKVASSISTENELPDGIVQEGGA